jgi:hypothetical protein
MAGSKTDYAENKVLDAILNATSFSVATPYVALFTATPSDSGGGTEVSTSGTAYARVASTTSWPTASAGSCANDVAIAFATATANWGTVTQFAIMDASTAGNMLYWGDLTTPRTINNGDPTPTFAIGALVITEG